MSWFGDLISKTPIIGDIAGGFINAGAQRDVNEQQIALSRENTSLARQDANSAHQREVADLKAAGLNPILSAGGNGAPVQQGSTPNLTAPQIAFPNLMSIFKDLKQIEQTDKVISQGDSKIAIEGAKTAADISNTTSDTELNRVKKILLNRGMPRAEVEGEAAKIIKGIIQEFKKPKLNYKGEPKTMDEEMMRMP